MIDRAEYAGRISEALRVMEARSIDCLALSASSDLTYLCGYEAMPLERLTLLVIGVYGEPVLVVPELEAPRVDDLDGLFTVRPWADGEDMLGAAVSAVRAASPPAPFVAVAERMWASTLLGLQEKMAHARFVPSGRVMRQLRIRKSPAEVDLLREAAQAIDNVVSTYGDREWVGRREADVAAEIGRAILDTGHQSVNFVIVGSGPNGASPHHDAGSRVIEHGDTIVMDIGGTRDAYCSDITRVVTIGEPASEVSAAYAALRRAQEEAVASVKPGVTAESVDAVARGVLTEAGYGERFIHRTGHGIGLDEHEDPYIVGGNDEELEAGMCFSIEPGVYISGRFGLRLEDIVCCGADGVDPLNRVPHDLIVVT